jgi:hypothetical protein
MILGVMPLAMSVWKPLIAGDGDETEGKQLAGDDQTGAVHELRHGGHLDLGQHQQHAGREGDDRAQLHERAQVISRREQQPHRQDAGGDPINDDGPGERFGAKREGARSGFMAVNPLAAPHRGEQQHHANDRTFQRLARPDPAQVAAHEQGDGNRGADGEDTPRTFGQRLDHHESEHRQQDDHDPQDRDQREAARKAVQLILHHLPE